jgi:hypothetical protein
MDASTSTVNEPPVAEFELPLVPEPPLEFELPPAAEFEPPAPPVVVELPPELGPVAPSPRPGPDSTEGLHE